ncbi:glycosyltransferase [archaeon]|jgi:glycosyltransferase involved in cell wall biosynthesis|nr:glycosyltransferase [archaeon]MBT3730756.1 glycosyltransferase [archaeon]MBT4669658.1 glycosyltransferase [archaeon]MBT5030415.1 glycosyltransferase [archaeon]MBT5288292.1 glycosyltransferase [archaeon]
MSLSIIIPAYNEEKYIEETLKTITKGEIIVVCNACTDNTADIARKYTNKVIELPIKGVSRARNIGAQYASNNRLIFLDADIKMDNKILDKIEKTKYNIGTSKVKSQTNKFIYNFSMKIKSLAHNFGVCTGLIFCDKLIFDRVGGFDETLSKKEDGKFLRVARKKGDFGIVNAYVYNNMRRFEKLGLKNVCLYWIKQYTFPDKKEYETIR